MAVEAVLPLLAPSVLVVQAVPPPVPMEALAPTIHMVAPAVAEARPAADWEAGVARLTIRPLARAGRP